MNFRLKNACQIFLILLKHLIVLCKRKQLWAASQIFRTFCYLNAPELAYQQAQLRLCKLGPGTLFALWEFWKIETHWRTDYRNDWLMNLDIERGTYGSPR